ncbi:MAG: hypothetical protein EZS28_026341 [Streblomastix strix]|uniref:Carbohydrate kinase FGGY C-terminal domain-containing protein n=1 Tax=Streblomastix strix TaxID=222440 RepID=A0A5J4V6T0_9EUKA|nr:MAG: hypothetical protein EZS28_026341 [Streblomastix strix]
MYKLDVIIQGFEQPHDIGTLAKQVEDTGDIVFVPSFQGFFAPRWRSDVRATFVGISLQAEPAHFARALEEAIALQFCEVLVSMGEDRQNERVKQKMEKEKESEKQNDEQTETNEKEDKKQEEIEKKLEKEEQEKLKKERIKERNEQLKLKQKLDNEKLKDEERNQIQKEIQKYLPSRVVVDGGPTEDEFLMQLQADFLNAEVVRPQNIEATALGAAMAAGLAVGVWPSLTDMIESIQSEMIVWAPKISDELRNKKVRNWERAVEATLSYRVHQE